MRIGGIEAGGTKMVCAIGEVQTDKGQPGENQVTITERVTIPTEKPKITLPRMAAFFEGKGISSLGIGCFGPVDLHRASPTYGYITSTPKLNGRMSIWWELLHGRSASRSDLIRT